MDIICSFRMEATLVANTFIDKYTEADVKRALAYWERVGALETGAGTKKQQEQAKRAKREDGVQIASEGEESCEQTAAAALAGISVPAKRPLYSQEQVNRLADDEDFTQLLYIAQKYMNKVFTPRECEVFAYLYVDGGSGVSGRALRTGRAYQHSLYRDRGAELA